MNKKALKQSVKVLLQRLIALLMFLIGSKGNINQIAIIYFVLFYTLSLISLFIVNLVNPASLAFREESSKKTPLWDKIILPIFWVLNFIVLYLVAGVELSEFSKLDITAVVGFVVMLISFVIATKAMCDNPFMGTFSTVQKEKEQIVVTSGIYSVIRHPTYLSIILHCLSFILIFKTVLTSVVASFIIVLIIFRTYKEDKYLKENLEGYLEYCKTTGLWKS